MNILIIGSGGREHAIAWKIKQSKKCDNLYIAPGNAGTSEVAVNINVGVLDFEGIKTIIKEKEIDLVIVGPEAPLVDGIRENLENDPDTKNVKIIGPGKDGAELEGSKDFAKIFMNKYNIPTAKSRSFTEKDLKEAKEYIQQNPTPVVLKADGLAAGKGVIRCQEKEEATEVLEKMLVGKMFGTASQTVVIEEFLEGIEVSVFVITDGKNYCILPEAKDYKPIGENNTGPNTGGMGSVSPVNFAQGRFNKIVEEKVIIPTIDGLKAENIDYKGFIFFGLMNVNGEPYVIEYNVRMGDPETQVVFPRIESDVCDMFEAAANGTLDSYQLAVSEQSATTVVMVAGGYPDDYNKGDLISGLENKTDDTVVFHAGTKMSDNKVVTNGGRVLAVTALGKDVHQALDKSYDMVEKIRWDDVYFRKDIGQDLIALG